MEYTEDNLLRTLKQYFGFDTFRGNQVEIIKNVLKGDDTFVLMPTGGGKSLCYQLPALIMEGTAIIVSPLIALMKNQVDAIRGINESNSIAHFLNSSLSKSAIEKVKEDVLSGKTKLLYCAPETLNREESVEFFKQFPISFYAIDEAHCISEWGHDFRPEYRRIKTIVESIGKKAIIALTATATPKVQLDIQKNLGMMDAKVYKSSFNRENLYYEVRNKTDKVENEIVRFIKGNSGKSGIVYCLSRRKVEEFTEVLQANDIKALAYHAGLDQNTRNTNQDAFLKEKVDVIVATIAFGMGIDKPDVRFVIHYNMPKSLEAYYQETGRAGRDGGEGNCIVFYSVKDLQKIEKLMQGKPVSEQETAKLLLNEARIYAETSLCRKKVLLHYFGEEYNIANCGHCDNCIKSRKEVEAKELLLNILEGISELKGKFKSEYIINVLHGDINSEVESFGHNELEAFGSCDSESSDMLATIINQAITAGFLEKDVENYGTLTISKKGKSFIKKPVSFKVILQNDDDDENMSDDIDIKGGGDVADTVLFSIMKDLRKKMAKDMDVPTYVIFQDPSLEAMATFYPLTIDELQNIPGVGAGKAKKYGTAFLDVIKKYVVENDIDRPEDLRIKTVANKSKLKVEIVQSIDRKVALDDLAESKGLEFTKLLDEIEAIVFSGTKINIDYFIKEIMDDDSIDEVFQYFQEAESEDLEKAINELDAFSEDEIRLVRIKFLSDMAN